jgi:hypothetical protein
MRMSGFTSRTTVEAAFAWLDAHLGRLHRSTPLAAAYRRVLPNPSRAASTPGSIAR